MLTHNDNGNLPDDKDSIQWNFFSKAPDEGYSGRYEDELSWFNGSLIPSGDVNLTQYPALRKQFRRLSNFHNRITHDFTNFDERFVSNRAVAYQLSEFFPRKWMTEILRILKHTKFPITCPQDRYIQVLGFIELFLNFLFQKILHSTLDEINHSYDLSIQMNDIRSFKIQILRKIPELREKYLKSRSKTQRAAFVATVILVMNKEMVPSNDWSKHEIFLVKKNCITLAQQFTTFKRSKYIKKGETWARALILKAVREFKEGYPIDLLFPSFDEKRHKVIENKRWYLDKDFDNCV